VIPEGKRQRLEVNGSYSRQCGSRTVNLAPLPADAHASGLILALWQELGGRVDGQVRPGLTPADAVLLARHDSAPLSDVVRDINKFSNNVMARQLFLTLGNHGAPASSERATARLADWLRSRRLNFPELVIDNGSGLSRSERISAGNMNRLLLDAWRSPVMPEFIASLPLAGVDGTMKKRLNGDAASGRAHIKTGTLNGVRTAAGYVLDTGGRRHALSFFINDPRAQAGGEAIDALLNWLAESR
jgi:D-alanyl-D-alanine carboxypeptidase/D-alanyl-D-alanine-endopeptidase (penicillin-binding protein 4)